jgi:acetyl-CoA carboxylase carboxyltransferase component
LITFPSCIYIFDISGTAFSIRDLLVTTVISILSGLTPKGAVEIIFRADIGDTDKIAQRTKEYEDRFLSPFVAAERGYIDEVISPNSTRKRIARALALLRHKELENPWKKHDNIPL